MKDHDTSGGEREPRRGEPMWRRYQRMFRADPTADLDDELRDHLESTVESLVARGMSPEAARAEALRRFGDVSRVRQAVRTLDERHLVRTARLGALESLLYDLRHAARGLRRSPAFTAVAALSIALGVAANATVFSVVNSVLLRPIPGTHAPRLVRVYVNHHSPFDWHDLSWFREHATTFDHIVGERYGAMSFRADGGGTDAERVHSSYVTHGFFSALGVRMALGRAADVDEANAGTAADAAVVLSHAFWQRRFAGDSDVVGRTIWLGGHPLTVAGVAAPGFRSSVMMWTPDVFVPFALAPLLTGQRLSDFGGSFYTTGRLRAGVSRGDAENELGVLMRQLARTDSLRYERMTVRLDHVRGVNAELRTGVAAGSAFLMVMVGLVLLIACANVANLLLGRGAARRTEIGVRMAIGAGRGRVVRQLLTESLMLAAAGSALGLAIAWALTRVLPAALPAEAGLDAAFFTPDHRVLFFTGAVCVLSTLLFGAMPALRAASPNLVGLLKGAAAASEGRARRRGVLVSVQSAMCVVLLAVAALFLRSLSSMERVDPGFRPDGVIDATVDLGLLGSDGDRAQLFADLLKDASSLPGVQSATLTAVVPLSGSNMETRVAPEGVAAGADARDYQRTYFDVVAPRYFETLRTSLLRGREFLETDAATAPRVAVVNETAARRMWAGGEALGKRFHWGAADGPLVQVVGVAHDADYVMPGEAPKPVVYVPLAQEPRDEMTLQLRTTANVETARRAVWELLRRRVPALPPPPVVRMSDDMAITLLPVRAGATLLGAFGGLALLLAAAGIYGVASYSVARRTREIGIRAALGATRARLMAIVLLESGWRVGVGAVVGVILTVGVGAGLSRVLYGVRPLDPVVLAGVVLLIAVVAIAATFGPARRAAAADPMAAMRSE